MNYRNRRARFHRFYRVITRQRVCVYCGVPATTIDHFVPLSIVSLLSGLVDEIQGKVLVPACGECNGMAADSIFPTIAAKRRFIHAKIRKKYRRILATPHWNKADLEDVSYSMGSFIHSGLATKQWVEERLGWRNTNNSEPVVLAKIRFNHAARGNNIARKNASRQRHTEGARN